MKKQFIIYCVTITALIFGCSALAGGNAKIRQAHSVAPLTKKSQLKTMTNHSYCGDGTHIRVINRSDYLVYVRIPASNDAYDFPVYPAYQGNNIDYIDSDDYYSSLYIIILAADDYTVLYSGYVPNCQNLYVDNPYYANNALKASHGNDKLAIPKHLRISFSKE